VSYFSVDGLGSVVATNDAAGTVTHSVVFDAWGITKGETGTRTHPFTYTGREVGEGGDLFYRARYYQPGVGRFGAEDPIGFNGGINLFRYANADPIELSDPFGLQAFPGLISRMLVARHCSSGPCPPEKRRFFDWLAGPLGEMAKRLNTNPEFLLNQAAREGGWLASHLDHNMPLNNPFGYQDIDKKTHEPTGNKQYGSLDKAITEWENDWGRFVKGAETREDFISRLQNPPKPKRPYNAAGAAYSDSWLEIDMKKWMRRCGIQY
jgi:RHS repeat-associated protein